MMTTTDRRLDFKSKTGAARDQETHRVPLGHHLLHGLLQRVLLAGRLADAVKLGQERLQVHVDHLGQGGVLKPGQTKNYI